MTVQDKIAALAEINEEILLADGFEEALVGYVERAGGPTVAVYDTEKCISILQENGMTEEEAVDFFYYNVVGSYMGENTPVFFSYLDIQ
jgi:hypothetical protein